MCFLLAGCTGWKNKTSEPPPPVFPDAKYSAVDLDALLRFSGELARLPPAERLAECHHILQLNRSGQSLGLHLHLFLAQLLTEACGDIRETSGRLQVSMPEIKDERLRHFLTYQEEILNRLELEIEQRKSLEQQLKLTQQKAQKSHRQVKTREDELKSLQDKLDALKSIEQNLGGSKGH